MDDEGNNSFSRNTTRLDSTQREQIVSLLSQVVTTSDMIRVEAKTAGYSELSDLLTHLGTLSLDAARSSEQNLITDESVPVLCKAVTNILDILQEIQRAAALVKDEFMIAQELLGIELATLRVKTILGIPVPATQRGASSDYPNAHPRARLLIVDDDDANREILVRLLRAEPYELELAGSADAAFEILSHQSIDLLLLDVLMPGMDGIAMLCKLHTQPDWAELPVLMLSGVDQLDSVVTCLELGARDYLPKPFHPALLKARIRSALEHRRLELSAKHREGKLSAVLQELQESHQHRERWLRNILPSKAVEELLSCGSVTPRYHDDVTIVFTDFVNFTELSAKLGAYELVDALNEHFTAFDQIVTAFGLERLKTIGDSYVYVSGLSERTQSHVIDAVLAALDMLSFVDRRPRSRPWWAMRVGMNTGPVVSGVVGTERHAFDVWGDTVNLASRMVDSGVAGRINLSASTFQRVKEFFLCEPRGSVEVKGGRMLEMFLVSGAHPSMLSQDQRWIPELFRARYRAYFERDLATLPASLSATSTHL